jgi:hypothetical protein
MSAMLGWMLMLGAAQDLEKGGAPNPKLQVPPVDEPDMAIDAKSPERADFVAPLQGGGYLFERKDVDGKRVPGVAVPGVILVTRGLVELFGCGEGGKEHETIIRLQTGVQALDLALTASGFTRGKLPAKTDLSLADQGSRVLILVQWLNPETGALVTHRSEDLVVSTRRGRTMPRVGWTYVGHWMEIADPTSPKGDKKYKVLAAANTRSYVTTFRDKSALMDNPLEEAVDDTVFAANYMVLPREGTPVRIIFRGPTAAERKEILVLEEDVRKNRVQFVEDERQHEEDHKKK